MIHHPVPKIVTYKKMNSPVSCRVSILIITVMMMMMMMMSPSPATAQSHRNISLNSFLVADDSNSTWRSPSGEFGFGFRQVSPAGDYLLAIVFDEMPERTIVWSANRGRVAERGSRVQLSADGFELTDPRGDRIWAASLSESGVAYGAMLDNGNFVLARNNFALLWQSFDEPTDTLLPGQVLNQGNSLFSSFSETNHSRGRFMFTLQTDGNLLLYTLNSPREDPVNAYWSTQTSIGAGYRLIFNQSGFIYLVARNGTILNDIFSNEASTNQFHQRLTLDYDGVLRHYLYPKSANSTNGRQMSWYVSAFEPSNICTRTGGDLSAGACGFNSLCSLGTDQRPICSCPDGYSIMDPTDRMSGCKPDFVQQSCDRDSLEVDNFEFVDMASTDWLNLEYDYFESVSEEWCRQACLVDCFCHAVVIRDRECWKKGFPLRNGRIDTNGNVKSLIKVRVRNGTGLTNPFGGDSDKSAKRALIITGSALLSSSVFFNLLLLTFVVLIVFSLKRKNSEMMNVHACTLLPGMNIRSFGFKELEEATNGFSEELGSGACSRVYKGALRDENGKIVAVKKLDKIENEADLEFKAEVSSISRTNHKNLVQLLGYCDEGQNKLLVYEYMQNGSLASYLFGTSPRPNWYRRVQIAFDVARGLCYLHEESTSQIIHCDIKPHNVLLDVSYVAKISDFGLAKLLKPDQTRTNTGIRGTRGYVAPEWFRNMPITAKVDVYSFGILLLELLCCRKNYENEVENESEMVLADWAYDCYTEGTLGALLAGDEVALDDFGRFEKFVKTAIWCVQEDPALRPQMKRVLHMLEGSVEVPAPPDPTSFVN